MQFYGKMLTVARRVKNRQRKYTFPVAIAVLLEDWDELCYIDISMCSYHKYEVNK